jgi:hypothetical protein
MNKIEPVPSKLSSELIDALRCHRRREIRAAHRSKRDRALPAQKHRGCSIKDGDAAGAEVPAATAEVSGHPGKLATETAHGDCPAGRQHRPRRRTDAPHRWRRDRRVAVAASTASAMIDTRCPTPSPAEAGVVLQTLHERRPCEADRFFPLSLGARGSLPPSAATCPPTPAAPPRSPMAMARELVPRAVEVVLADRPQVLDALSQAEEGQHRLRPAQPVRRRGRHARHHHRRRAESCFPSRAAARSAGRASPRRKPPSNSSASPATLPAPTSPASS